LDPAITEAALIFAVSAALAGVVYITVRFALSKSSMHDVAKMAIHYLVAGPVVAAILGYGLVESVAYLFASSPGALPGLLAPADITPIVEVAVLAVTVRVTGSIVKTATGSLDHLREAGRVLVYSVYTLGLVALIYIGLSSPVSPGLAGSAWSTINFLTGLLVTYLVVSTVNVILKRYSEAIHNNEQRLKTALTFIRRLVLVVLALVGVAISTFSSFPGAGTAIASVFVAAGFASIVVGLAAQSSLSNIFAGMVLAFSQPFKIGDAVLFSNEWAWVEDMRLNFTVLRTWDNRRLVVPNQMFLGAPLINYDLNDSSKLCIVFVTISYESDVDKAIEIMKEAAKKHPDFLPAGDLPVVHLMDLGDANGTSRDADASPGVSLRLLSRAKDQPTNFQMSKDLLYSIRREFLSNGIEIAYPKRSLSLSRDTVEALGGRTSSRDKGGSRDANERG
jgi:small-conductance mechanosensitive channel